jgi:hypothetical protein
MAACLRVYLFIFIFFIIYDLLVQVYIEIRKDWYNQPLKHTRLIEHGRGVDSYGYMFFSVSSFLLTLSCLFYLTATILDTVSTIRRTSNSFSALGKYMILILLFVVFSGGQGAFLWK